MSYGSFTDKAIDHFKFPRNVGKLDDFNGEGYAGDPECGDYIKIYIKVDNNIIVDIGFLVFGCVGAIATSSITTELVKGKTLEEALNISDMDVIESLGGLPENKIHCSLLGPSGLKSAIKNYYDKISDLKKCLIENKVNF
ncbi:iron-sulfur cluster assembly scaffold protein [Anaerovorax odorimutans]|uniref:iron-sulfur cluster assembly scaffold protein n=1 Tax=Anaerovorax odorimutans TaxID=109327 RepID=UPI0003F84E47|nr:iron-sulfur cluster assembly scaffold protein [Anaerovorax odorimutans]